MELLLLHNHPDLQEKCCDLINAEWPRSRSARMRGLLSSCDNLPTCLLLVNTCEDPVLLVGHSKVSSIPSIPSAGFVESVVIAVDMRGRGLGKLLMHKTEDYMQSIGLRESYLATYDQQTFYTKLGYTFCERVSIFGSAPSFQQEEVMSPVVCKWEQQTSSQSPPPPPPPPPPVQRCYKPQLISHAQPQAEFTGKPRKDFMVKSLHL